MQQALNFPSLKASLHQLRSYFYSFLLGSVLALVSPFSSAGQLPAPSEIENKITQLSNSVPVDQPLIDKYQVLLDITNQFSTLNEDKTKYQDTITRYPLLKEKLLESIVDVETLKVFQVGKSSDYNDLSQEMSALQASVAQWQAANQTGKELTEKLTSEKTDLPKQLAEIDQQLEQTTLQSVEALSEIESWLLLASQQKLTLERQLLDTQLQSLDERTELHRLEQQLITRKLQIAAPLMITLQNQLTQQEQASVRLLINKARILSSEATNSDPIQEKLSDSLRTLAIELEKVLVEIDRARIESQRISAERRSLSDDQDVIKANLSWLRESTAFGASIRAQLQRLPINIGGEATSDEIANAHIRKYELSQDEADIAVNNALLATQSSLEEKSSLQMVKEQLVKQLSVEYDKLITELTTLQSERSQYEIEVNEARNFLQEQQLWTRSNVPLWQSLQHWNKSTWFGLHTPLSSILDNVSERQKITFSALLLIYTLLLVFVNSRLVVKARSLRHEYKKHFGHPLRDKFRFTLKLLGMAVLRASCLPLWFGLTTYGIYLLWPIQTSSEPKDIIMASSAALFALEFIYALSFKHGVLSLHLNWPEHIAGFLHTESKKLRWPLALLLLLMFCSELVSGTEEAEFSRLLFLTLIAATSTVFYSLLRSDSLPKVLPSAFHTGVGLFLLRVLILGSFVAIAVMAILGMYVASWMLLIYQQATILVALLALITFQLGERWLKLEHIQLTYQRLLMRREELIAQQKEADENREFDELRETLPEVEEQSIDSSEVSEQSLTLLRSFSVLGLLLAFLALWSNALETTSFLESIVIWEVNETTESGTRLVGVTLQSIVYALITIVVTVIAVKNLPGILELLVLRRLTLSPGTGYAVTTILRYLILMAGTMSAFTILGFQWSKLQWLVAAFGVGLGFGLQEIFANFISGLILLFERPIRIGDIVTINQLSGTVSKIQTRATTIIDWDNKEIVVPNKAFITEKLINWSLTDPITRIVIPIGVAYGSDIEKVESILYEIATSHPLVLEEPSPSVFFLAFGASSLDFELRVYITAIDHRLSTIHIINKDIDRRFKENGIEIAFPQMDLHIRDMPSSSEDN
ncbi:mechanosensitive ion channel [Vibrio sp. SCSIO 43140]|uniref:mechanosensitive ion channel domain-containing protein n=1 Tax=Vibrio sp. SCSIO 43140 TaxID=2819100 RepID=UPI002074CC0D|nr:mechanosensitive ion channel domain-containing protein [Vibrio sp. SCSIO 43140]USD61878.1 mechanosensitive ion channel [Vibrio sp. SCSIO 43140]